MSNDILKISDLPTKVNGMGIDECLDNLWLEVGDPFDAGNGIIGHDCRTFQFENQMLSEPWEDKLRVPELVVEVCRNPDYLHFVAKYVLGIDLLPFQCVILATFWNKPLPMLIASRGASKSFLIAVYICLRCLLHQGCKVCVVGASLRQSMVIFNYIQTIWESAPVLRDICGGNANAPKRDQHICYWKVGQSRAVFLPLGDGCLVGDTFIQDHDCFIRLADKIPVEDLNKDHQVFENNRRVFVRGRRHELSDESYYNGIRPVRKITSRFGYDVTGTLNHKVRVCVDGEIVWKEIGHVQIGDRIVIDRSETWHSVKYKHVSDKDAYAAGLMVGDGCWTMDGKLSFATTDSELVKHLNAAFSDGLLASKDGIHHNCYGKQFKEDWLNYWGFTDGCYAIDKTFPPLIMGASKEAMAAFLSGLFDTDGTIRHNKKEIVFYNTSYHLVKTIQYILLKFGIVSSFRENKNPSKQKENYNTLYELFIHGHNAELFCERIGFRLPRKQNRAANWSDNPSRRLDRVPTAEKHFRKAIADYNLVKRFSRAAKNLTYYQLDQLLDEIGGHAHSSVAALEEIRHDNLFFDEVTTIEDLPEAPTYDIHVPNGHEYNANGFLVHNSKIRGQRANIICADEFSSISSEIFETVVRGFAAVKSDGVHGNVVNAYKSSILKHFGVAAANDFEGGVLDATNGTGVPTMLNDNQIILAGTAYYRFNHFYRYWKWYQAIITSGGDPELLKAEFPDMPPPDNLDPSKYAVIRIPYNLIPAGMMDETILNQGRAIMDPQIFDMEYGACFPEDSEGFYLASWLHICTSPVKIGDDTIEFGPRINGDRNLSYVMGIDPASENDNFAINILEIRGKQRRCVYQWTTNRKDFEGMKRENIINEKIHDYNTFCVTHIRDLCRRFNVVLVVLDDGGGGISIRESLKDPTKMLDSSDELILDMDDDNVKGVDGKHILKMISFSNSAWRKDSHYGLRKDILDKKVLFPKYDADQMMIQTHEDSKVGKVFDTMEDCFVEIEQCKQETTMIQHNQTAGGTERWDVPKIIGVDSENNKTRLKKDRFTSLLLSNWGARLLQDDDEDLPVTESFLGGTASNILGSSGGHTRRGAAGRKLRSRSTFLDSSDENIRKPGGGDIFF